MKRNSSKKSMFKVMGGAAFLLAAISIGVLSLRPGNWSPTAGEPAQRAANDGAAEPAHTLNPNQFQGVVKKAYQIAEREPGLLAQLKCYCKCDHLGHSSLLDCFRDNHAAGCGICLDEALDANWAASRGFSVEQIRQGLQQEYSRLE